MSIEPAIQDFPKLLSDFLANHRDEFRSFVAERLAQVAGKHGSSTVYRDGTWYRISANGGPDTELADASTDEMETWFEIESATEWVRAGIVNRLTETMASVSEAGHRTVLTKTWMK